MLKNVTESVLGSGTKDFYLCKQEVLGMDAVLSRALFSRNCLSPNMVLLLLTLNIFCERSVLKETKTFASKSAVRNGLLVLSVTATVLQWTAINKHSYFSSVFRGGERGCSFYLSEGYIRNGKTA